MCTVKRENNTTYSTFTIIDNFIVTKHLYDSIVKHYSLCGKWIISPITFPLFCHYILMYAKLFIVPLYTDLENSGTELSRVTKVYII